MESLNKPTQSAGGPMHTAVAILLAPSIIGFLCSLSSQANPGDAWRLFAGFGNSLGILRLAAAILVALVATARRRISGQLLLLMLLEVGAVAVVSWVSVKLIKNPFF